MRSSLAGVLLFLLATPVSAQHLLHGESGLAHGIPDLCAGSPDNVGVGTSATFSGSVTKGCVGVHGTLTIANGTTLTVETLLVYEDGTLIIGSGAACPATDVRIRFQGTLDLVDDPEQFGVGLVGLGTIRIFGEAREPFIRLAAEIPLAGAQTLTLVRPPTNWKVGDRILVPDTRQAAASVASQIETRTITQIVGATLTLDTPLAYPHKGAREDGLPTTPVVFTPHVANLTRSIVVESVNPTGTRGHVVFVHRASVDVEGAEFRDLGRTRWEIPLDNTTFSGGGAVTHVGTNQIGKYALHLHHLFGETGLPSTTPQFTVVGNLITNSSKWGITLHNAHHGLIDQNVIVNGGGAGIMTEDGSESENTISRNFVVGTPGTGQRGDARGNREFGFEGTGIWLRGPRNRLTENVTVDNRFYGISYFANFLGHVTLPNFKGADPTDDGTDVDGNNLQLIEDRDNEIYGVTENGMEFWWLGTEGKTGPKPNAPLQLFQHLVIWHTFHKSVFNYHSKHVTFDRLTLRGDLSSGAQGTNYGFEGGDYLADDLVLLNADIRGKRVGIKPSQWSNTWMTIQGGILQNRADIQMETLQTSAYAADAIPARRVTATGVTFLAPSSGSHLRAYMWYRPGVVKHLVQSDTLLVDGQRVYYKEQAPSFVVPASIFNADGTHRSWGADNNAGVPLTGLTNAQLLAQYGHVIGGALAPCTTAPADILGYVCP